VTQVTQPFAVKSTGLLRKKSTLQFQTCHWLIWWFKWLGSFDWTLSDSGYLPPGHERLRKSGSLAGDVKAGREVFADISSYLFQK